MFSNAKFVGSAVKFNMRQMLIKYRYNLYPVLSNIILSHDTHSVKYIPYFSKNGILCFGFPNNVLRSIICLMKFLI